MAKDPEIKKLIEDFLQSEVCPFGPPFAHGVYGIFAINLFVKNAKGHLLYIGSSKHIFNRVMASTHPYRKLFDRFYGSGVAVYIKTLITDDYHKAEKILIRHLRPRLNKTHK